MKMQITRKLKVHKNFMDVEVGEVFTCPDYAEDSILMRTQEEDSVVNLENGDMITLANKDECVLLETELLVKREVV